LRHGPKSATSATTRKILANQSVDNDPDAVMRVVAPFGGNVHAALEVSTGAAALTQKYSAEQLIAKSGWLVELAHPGYVARMKQTPDKSDWTDAKLLADLTRTGYIPRVWLAPKYIRELRELVRHRHGLVEQRKQVKLRLRALLRNHRIVCPHSPWTIAWNPMEAGNGAQRSDRIIPRSIRSLHFVTLPATISCDVADDPVVRQLLGQAGIGIITAVTMRALIGRFDRFRTGKQLAHFCALCPRNNSSATSATTQCRQNNDRRLDQGR
jgi:transposase